MIKLTSDLFIAKGTERSCFIHPNDPKLCIKVCRSSNNKQHKQELAYLNFLLKKGRLPCDVFPKFYGSTETDRGLGLVFERIYNEDDTNTESLKVFLIKNSQDLRIDEELTHLKLSLLKHKIIVRDLNMNNILVKTSKDSIKLMLIDGIGNSDFIPLANYLNWYADKKINRRWNRFESAVKKYRNMNTKGDENGSATQSS